MHLPEVVARDLGEEVVVDLVLEPPAEPVHERRARDVTRGGDLGEAGSGRGEGARGGAHS